MSRPHLGTPALALLCAAFTAFHALPAQAAPPTIDGNLTDMQQFATDLQSTNTGIGIVAVDPTGDVQVLDPKVVPCPPVVGGYFQNGFDQTEYVVAQASGSSDLYLGIRVAGVIGDADGDGNPDLAGSSASCNPLDNVLDSPGISPGESYQFLFDTVCGGNFNPNGVITITNDQVIGSGVFSGITGTIAYRGPGGHDLEVLIHNITLPPAFLVKTFVGSNTDGLSEDVGPTTSHQPSPGVKILKTATPIRVCAGKTTRFTITVQNTGNSDLNSTVVEDDLPPGLAFAGNVSSTCNVGAPQANGSAVLWPAFDLPFGASCTIAFDALAAPGCIGAVTNLARVTAATTGPCVQQPPQADQATFVVTCVPNPCVQVTAQGPPDACPGQPITIQGTVANCSSSDETILVTVNGQQALSASVAAGVTMPWSFATSMPQCTAGQTSAFAVAATGTNECGADAESAPVAVLCKPCLTGCVVSSTIHSDFNGTAIVGASSGPAYIWFNSNLSVKGMTAGKSIVLTGSKVLINGVPYDIPDAHITFAAVACATTTFDPGTRTWLTTVPLAGSDEIFISGLALPVTNLAAGAKVEWQGTFGTDQPGICFSWKWGAAAYKSFSLLNGDPLAIDYNAAQIKPTHQAACLINNGDHAGTPQNPAIRAAVTGGARGGGGSNFTGSWSGTGAVCPVCPPVGAGGGSRLSSIALSQEAGVPQELSFASPSPNPSNGPSSLRFDLPREASVSLRAYGVSGRMVRELATGTFSAGTHTLNWDLLDRNGHAVPAGVYFLRLAVDGRVLVRSLSITR